MQEIGGYMELERFNGSMLHQGAVKLNCARNALRYVVRAKGIRKIRVPGFLCDSCNYVLKDMGVAVTFYSIGSDFKPVFTECGEDEWFYVVNYYGQLSDEYLETLRGRVIVDNVQAYFRMPVSGVDTLYSCRKFFGVPDGAFLYTDTRMEIGGQEESFERMRYLLGRFEHTASEFYDEYVNGEKRFQTTPVKRMSKLTENLLHAVDYDFVKERRTMNFKFLHEKLCAVNKLSLTIPEGAFMYPLYIENGAEVRKKLQEQKIYIPILWPDVFGRYQEGDLEYDMAENILPIPVDQRYAQEEMAYLALKIKELV